MAGRSFADFGGCAEAGSSKCQAPSSKEGPKPKTHRRRGRGRAPRDTRALGAGRLELPGFWGFSEAWALGLGASSRFPPARGALPTENSEEPH
jgi:hypothetical protein